MTRTRSYWMAFQPLWIKFCGIADEYSTTRHRWSFASDRNGCLGLPPIGQTFDRLDRVIRRCEETFGDLGFRRDQVERQGDFSRRTGRLHTEDLYERYVSLNSMILDLSQYLGTIKMVFLQRTISSEIPHSITFYSHGIERTLGNESMHSAADKVAASYVSCLSLSSDVVWDGVVSFMYPMFFYPILNGHLHGAFASARPIAKLYHFSLSEEGKYFPGSYLFLAHEVGHAVMTTVRDGESDHTNWSKLLWGDFYIRTHSLRFLHDLRPSFRLFLECLADVIAVHIGGPCTVHALADFAPYDLTLARLAFVSGYFADNDSIGPALSQEIDRLCREIFEIRTDNNLVRTMRRAGQSIRSFDLEFGSIFYSVKCGNNTTRLEKAWPQLDLGVSNAQDILAEPALMPRIVKNGRIFSPSTSSVDAAKGDLAQGNTIEKADPRLILHAYYALLRENANPPSYAATLYSLCFNTFAVAGPEVS